MKGVELLSSLIALLILLGMSSLLGGLLVFIINLAESPSTHPINYEMYFSPQYPPIKYETMLLSYLESTETASGYQIKKILAYAAYQRNVTNVFVDELEIKTLGSSTSTIFNQWIPTEAYLLELTINGKDYIIAENERAIRNLANNVLRMRRISVPVYIDIETAQSFKPDKTSVLPLNITLDFYVQ
jgi:hypothetical protein